MKMKKFDDTSKHGFADEEDFFKRVYVVFPLRHCFVKPYWKKISVRKARQILKKLKGEDVDGKVS